MNKRLQKTYQDYFGLEWYEMLKDILHSDYFNDLRHFLAEEKKNKNFLPENISLSFRAFRETPFDNIKIVIIGQDIYHDGSFDGLAFSNANREGISPSLQNILKEIKREYPNSKPNKDLTYLANQGVFLINVGLTVIRGHPGSHLKKWKNFTRQVITIINNELENVVFLLWGNFAASFGGLVDESKHTVIISGHPSPLNKTNPFIGCDCFKDANEYLKNKNKKTINW